MGPRQHLTRTTAVASMEIQSLSANLRGWSLVRPREKNNDRHVVGHQGKPAHQQHDRHDRREAGFPFHLRTLFRWRPRRRGSDVVIQTPLRRGADEHGGHSWLRRYEHAGGGPLLTLVTAGSLGSDDERPTATDGPDDERQPGEGCSGDSDSGPATP